MESSHLGWNGPRILILCLAQLQVEASLMKAEQDTIYEYNKMSSGVTLLLPFLRSSI